MEKTKRAFRLTGNLALILFSLSMFISCKQPKAGISGELKKWHRVTLVFEGPKTGEMAEDNPFLNYRLDVTFTNGDQQFVVPGFYAADGNAAETSVENGNKWMARFTPNREGAWNYAASFKQGENVSIATDVSNAASAGLWMGNKVSFPLH